MDTPAELLKARGLRVTRPRLAVLAEVAGNPHADVDTIAGAARGRLGSVSQQAVYDVLRSLTDAGLLRRVEPAGSPARYEIQTGDNHHHLVCRDCGAITDVPCGTGRPPCLTPPTGTGFVVDEAEVTFWGICPNCRTALGPIDANPDDRRTE